MTIINIILGLLGLSLVIVIHESGHYLLARLCKIKVEAFSVGMGPRIWGFTRNGTDYRISAIPLGGYCRMSGEQDMSNALQKNLPRIEASPGSYYAASPFKRILVVLAGPLFNLIFAILVMSTLWLVGTEYYSNPAKIALYSEVSPGKTYPANDAGLKSGDEITEVNGSPIRNFHELQKAFGTNALKKLDLEVKRGDQTLQLGLTPELEKSSGRGVAGVVNWINPIIDAPGPIAKAAGLKEGDKILQVNGQEIQYSYQILSLLTDENSGINLIQVERQGEILNLEIPLSHNENKQAYLDFSFVQNKYIDKATSLGEAFVKGWNESIETLEMTISSLGLLFSGLEADKAVSGPLRITYMIGEASTQSFSQNPAQGVRDFFELLALISIALFFGNLLPIPALDGGQFIMFVGEAISRRPLSPNFIQKYQLVGIFLVLGLTVFAFYGDIKYFLTL